MSEEGQKIFIKLVKNRQSSTYQKSCPKFIKPAAKGSMKKVLREGPPKSTQRKHDRSKLGEVYFVPTGISLKITFQVFSEVGALQLTAKGTGSKFRPDCCSSLSLIEN